MKPEDRAELRKAWASFINDFAHWELYSTLTFTDERLPTRSLFSEFLDKCVKSHIAHINYMLPRQCSRLFKIAGGYELQRNGNPHIHMLTYHPEINLRLLNLRRLNEMWAASYGWARVWPVWQLEDGSADVSYYVAKYEVKTGRIFFGDYYCTGGRDKKLTIDHRLFKDE